MSTHQRLFLLSLPLLCIFVSWGNHNGNLMMISLWGFGGIVLGVGIFWLLRYIQNVSRARVISYVTCVSIGILLAGIFSWIISIISFNLPHLSSTISLIGLFLFPYISVMLGIPIADEYFEHSPSTQPLHALGTTSPKLIDTSSIIDGRVLDLCDTGFLEGPILIPRFVLSELHFIADSHSPWKRARGKRGLEVLAHLQNISMMQIHILEQDPLDIPEVDDKLINLAKQQQAKIITNDWNLGKIASLQGVQALNVNQLFHQLQPPVLPGEVIRVLINKEGDLAGQGVAHLDDGTMVVVDQARDYVRETVDVMITKFMQTHSGRILFGARL